MFRNENMDIYKITGTLKTDKINTEKLINSKFQIKEINFLKINALPNGFKK